MPVKPRILAWLRLFLHHTHDLADLAVDFNLHWITWHINLVGHLFETRHDLVIVIVIESLQQNVLLARLVELNMAQLVNEGVVDKQQMRMTFVWLDRLSTHKISVIS